jgi:hypothetical protein
VKKPRDSKGSVNAAGATNFLPAQRKRRSSAERGSQLVEGF